MRILIACERSGVVRNAFLKHGWDAWSCDLLPSEDASERHLQADCLSVLDRGWDMMIAHPDCTYLTNSAEWAYKEPPYHIKLSNGTLFGEERIRARLKAVQFTLRLKDAGIPRIVIENPVGHLSRAWRKPDQIIQPHQFGEDASKATCLWIEGDLPKLVPTLPCQGRIVEWPRGSGRMVERWANQTDAGQNNVAFKADRMISRARTYQGIAEAMAKQWTEYIEAKKVA